MFDTKIGHASDNPMSVGFQKVLFFCLNHEFPDLRITLINVRLG